MMRDARRGRFDVGPGLGFGPDRSVKHFLEVLDELNRLDVEFVSFREKIDTGGPLGRAIVVIIGAIAELERSLIVERVRAGMRRARLEGKHIGRNPLTLDNLAIQQDRQRARASGRSQKGIASRRLPYNACCGRQPDRASSPCNKRAPKTHPLNPSKHMAGSHRSGRVKRCGFGDTYLKR